MFEPRKIEPDQRLTAAQRAVVIIMNLMLLGEVTWAMYHGQQDPENLTSIFLRSFIPAAVSTVVVARLLIRKMRPVTPEPSDKAS